MEENLFSKVSDIAAEGLKASINIIPRCADKISCKIDSFSKADKPLSPKGGNTFVRPHHVDGYTKADGTVVSSYWRDGDGDTNIDLSREEGGGYFRNL